MADIISSRVISVYTTPAELRALADTLEARAKECRVGDTAPYIGWCTNGDETVVRFININEPVK